MNIMYWTNTSNHL